MLHLAALHAVARPLAVAALAIAGIAGPGLVVAHAAASMPAATAHIERCSTAPRASMAAPCAPMSMHRAAMGTADGGRH